MKVLLLSRNGHLGASSRIRFYQYLPYLKVAGIDVEVAPLLPDEYLRRLYIGSRLPMISIVFAYLDRLRVLLKSRSFDLLWIEYELFPWLPAWIETIISQLGVRYVVEYDDAIFDRYEICSRGLVPSLLRSKIDVVMRKAALVIVGNEYLGHFAGLVGANRVECVPTVVDSRRYRTERIGDDGAFTVGWIGTPGTVRYLNSVLPALTEICSKERVRLVLVGSGKVDLGGLPYVMRPWSEETEISEIQRFDVGIGPLDDGPWERGKCGYKLIQYMGCGRAVVASPVGVNAKIVEEGVTGFLARTTAEWVRAINVLRENPSLRMQMGASGRRKVETQYCLEVTAPRLISLLRDAAAQVP